MLTYILFGPKKHFLAKDIIEQVELIQTSLDDNNVFLNAWFISSNESDNVLYSLAYSI